MSKNKEYNEIAIGEIVATDFRAAEIFKNAGIDFCCGGEKSLDYVCNEKSIDPSVLVKQLEDPVTQPHCKRKQCIIPDG